MLAWSLQRFAWCLAAILAGTLVPAAAALDADVAPEVHELREALHAPVAANVPEPVALESRRQTISAIALRLSRLVDLRDALLLDTWRDGDADPAVAAIDGALRAGIRARFEAMIRVSLQAPDDATRLAAVSMIDETARHLRQQPFSSWNLCPLAPDLAELATTSRSKSVCLQATDTLGQLECDTPTIARTCMALLQSPDPEVRRRAAQAMSRVAATLRKVVDSQGGSSAWTVPAIARALGEILRVASIGLRDDDLVVRQASALGLDEFAQATSRLVLDPRVRGAEKPSADVNNLFRALHEETTGLTTALNDSDTDVRVRCRQALLAMAVAGQRWQQRMTGPSSQENCRSAPAGPLSNVDPQGFQASTPALARGLADPDVRARRAAAEALEGMGPEAQYAESGLVQALSDPDLFVRWTAVRALCRLPHLDQARAVPAIARLVRDPDLDVRMAAAKALGILKCSQAEGIDALARAVHDREPALQIAAIQALAAIGPAARSAIPAIAEDMTTPDPRVRTAAANGLAAFGSESAPYVVVLGSGTTDPDHNVRQAASNAALTIAAGPNRSSGPLVTTLELVSHDRPVNASAVPPAPPASLPVSATEASVPIGLLAATNSEPISRPSASGPDLGVSTAEHESPAMRTSPQPAADTRQIAPPPVVLPPPPSAGTDTFSALPPTACPPSKRNKAADPGGKGVGPLTTPAAAPLTVPDVPPPNGRLEAASMASVSPQPLNVAGWKPASTDRPTEHAGVESVRADAPFSPSQPIQAAFSAGGDYTRYNPPARLPAGVIAISPDAGAPASHALDSAAPPVNPTTWQSYKPAATDSVIAVSRPLPPGPPLVSPPAYALDPSRVIASSSPR